MIGVRLPVAAATVEKGTALSRPGCHIRKLVFRTEQGVSVPALLFAKEEKAAGPLVIYVHGDGKAADAGPGGLIEQRVKAGQRVLALDLRGLGETAPTGAPQRPPIFGVDVREAFLALHLNRPLLGQRVHDLLAVIAQLPDDSLADLHLLGVGKAGPIVLHAATLSPRVKRVTLERSLLSWSAVAETPLSNDQLTNVVPGVLAVYDLPELAALLAPRPLTIRSPVDPVGAAVARTVMEEAYALVKTAYGKQKAEKHLRLEAGRKP